MLEIVEDAVLHLSLEMQCLPSINLSYLVAVPTRGSRKVVYAEVWGFCGAIVYTTDDFWCCVIPICFVTIYLI